MQQIFKARVLKTAGILLILSLIGILGLSSCASKEYTHEILATGELGINEYSPDAPGQSTKLERESPGAPPVIPHSVEGQTVTNDLNSCLTCHTEGLTLSEGHTATKIPLSHYVDQVTGDERDTIQDIRYSCLLCHLQQSAEEPLVKND